MNLEKGAAYLFPFVIVAVFFGLWFTASVRQHGIAHSFDENSYLFQAHTFAEGRMGRPVKAEEWPLRDWWVLYRDGRAYSKYPPGYPALLAIGAKLGDPSVVNPLLTAGSLLVLFLAFVLLFGPPVALLTTLVLGSNSYWLGYGASFHSQSASLFWVAIAFFGVVVAYRDSGERTGWREHLLWGLAVGALLTTRPLDGFCLALAIAAASPRRFFAGPWVISAALASAGVLTLFTYNYVQSGVFALAAYPIWDNEFKLADPAATSAADNALRIAGEYARGLRVHVWPLLTKHGLGRSGLLLPLLTLAGLFTLRRKPILRFGAAFALLMVALYNFHHTLGWPQYGARYYYPCLAALAGFAAAAIEWGYRREPRLAIAVVLATVAVQIPHHLQEVRETSARFEWIARIRERIDRSCPPFTIVSIDAKGWRSPVPWLFPDDFSKNLMPWDSRYYATRESWLRTLQENFPERVTCRFSLAEHFPKGGS